ncbi:hypothetical protein BaRGS_00017613 [Batillaria attramentaria]|uniref:Uncharacterized protein n=1 Tax=Batillaria attramentaria TaxID=370345 RepID=A0ABD0KVS7_9CAEN
MATAQVDMAADEKKECPDCNSLQKKVALGTVTCIKLENNLEDLCVRKENRADFLKIMNALLNTEGGGAVIVHTRMPHCLDDFHQKVDDALKALIPDDSSFTDNFARKENDKNHVVFRVKPRPSTNYVSTFCFHTKMSLCKGLDNPSHGQIRRIINTISKEESQSNPVRENYIKLEKGREVRGPHGVFQESSSVQAKDVKRKSNDAEHKTKRVQTHVEKSHEGATSTGEPNCENTNTAGTSSYDVFYEPQFVNKCWDKLSVRDFISAFAKEDDGGVLYLGLEERKATEKGCPQTLYLCRGFRGLEQKHREEFCDRIREKVCTSMLWLGKNKPENPVDVIYHKPINGESDLRVVEIQVKYFHGLCFYYKEGPESYWFPTPLLSQPEKIKLEDWVVKNGGGKELIEQRPQFNSKTETDIDHNATG